MRGLRFTFAILLAGCLGVPVFAQRPRNNTPPPNQRQQDRHDSQQQNNRNQQNNNNNNAVPAPRFHGPGPHAGDWLRRNGSLPPEEQQKKLENDPNFQKLPPERQEKLKQRLQRFNNLTPDQKAQTFRAMEEWEHMILEARNESRR